MGQPKKHRRSLVWMRRALRVQDNLALWTAVRESEEVVPVMVLSRDRKYLRDTPRRRHIVESLVALDQALQRLGSSLVLRGGMASEELPALAREVGADCVYAVDIYDPRGRGRDRQIDRELASLGIRWQTVPDALLHPPGEILNGRGEPYRVFTPFKRAWLLRSAGFLPTLRRISAMPETGVIARSTISTGGKYDGGGEQAALRRWKSFLRGAIAAYAEQRDIPAIDGSSRMSAHLSLGTISVRRLYHDAMEARAGADRSARRSIDTFVSELIWREFYYAILMHFPHVVSGPFRRGYASIPWSNDRKAFEAWCLGHTGYPIVDAGMRQLMDEGWMHNRVRMIVASFLTKDLHINWQKGEQYFMDQLTDADIASNNGGWQWTAGTGTDASPWFRIFNPVSQGKRFDPGGEYVRRYVPELARVPARHIHSPWLMSSAEQAESRCLIGDTYPRPIVDHGRARTETLAMFRHASRGHVQ